MRHVVVTDEQNKVARSVNPMLKPDDMGGHLVLELECVGQQSRDA